MNLRASERDDAVAELKCRGGGITSLSGDTARQANGALILFAVSCYRIEKRFV
jgi:hypothetical protein